MFRTLICLMLLASVAAILMLPAAEAQAEIEVKRWGELKSRYRGGDDDQPTEPPPPHMIALWFFAWLLGT